MAFKITVRGSGEGGNIKSEGDESAKDNTPERGFEPIRDEAMSTFGYCADRNPEAFQQYWEGEFEEGIKTEADMRNHLMATCTNMGSAKHWSGEARKLLAKIEDYKESQEGTKTGAGAGSPEGGEGDDKASGTGTGSGEKEGEDEGNGEGEGEGEGEETGEEGKGGKGEGNPDLEARVAELERWREVEADPALKAGGLPQMPEGIPGEQIPVPECGDDFGWIPDGMLEQLLYEKMYGKDPAKEKELEEKRKNSGNFKPEWYDKALALLKAGKYLLLQGPSGCGKTHTAKMLVEEGLGLPFGMESCSESSHDGNLKGFLVPVEAGGNFIHLPSLFLSMCQFPGGFLWDELDAGDGNWLVGFNAMLAQRELFVPSRRLSTLPEFELEDIFEYWSAKFGPEQCKAKIEREKIKNLRDLRLMLGKDAYKALDDSFGRVKLHPEFRIIGAANTFGHGADMVYAGRNQLDGATLDRFRIGTFRLDYSHKVELSIIDPEVLVWGRVMRECVSFFKMTRRLITTRFLKDATDMKKVGWKRADWEEVYFADWDTASKEKVLDRYKTQIVEMLKGGK